MVEWFFPFAYGASQGRICQHSVAKEPVKSQQHQKVVCDKQFVILT